MDGTEFRDEDVAGVSPLPHVRIDMLGRYSLSVPDAVAKGRLRPLLALRRPHLCRKFLETYCNEILDQAAEFYYASGENMARWQAEIRAA